MATDTQLTELILNSMTKAQYDALATKDPNQVYALTDAKISVTDLDTSNAGTTGQILSKTADGMSWADPGDYVVETKVLTAENGTWYRKYKSGWVEQGGIHVGSYTVPQGGEGNLGPTTFPIVMANNLYTAIAQCYNIYCIPMGTLEMFQNRCTFRFGAYGSSQQLTKIAWYVCGVAA